MADVVDETADARSLVFTVPDGPGDPVIPSERLRYAPGQFLTLRVPSDRTGSVARCYSLCSSPFTGDPMTVTVKRTADGYASNWLCDHAHAGMKIHVLAPSGTFVPKTLDADFLLLAAGSGITPMMAICKSALSEGSGKVVLIYANRDENSVIFGGALRELAAKYPDRLTVVHWLETVQGLPSAAALAGLGGALRRPRRVHLRAGAVHGRRRGGAQEPGTPPERIHIEVFKSLESDPFAAVVIEDDGDEPPATAVVELDGETHTVSWPRNAKLLDVLLDKGLDAPFSCREGHCGACAVLKRSGEVADGSQRRARAARPRRGPHPRLPGAAAVGFRRSHLRRVAQRLTIREPEGSMMKRLASVLAAVSTTWLTLALVTPTAVSSAALDTADTSFPINEFTQLEVHTTANCVLADNAVLLPRRGQPAHAGGADRVPARPVGPPDHHTAVIGPDRLPGFGLGRPQHPDVQIHWAR